MVKLLGSVLVLLSCTGIGLSLVVSYRKYENALLQFIRALEYMEWELAYKMTPLPELCFNASQECTGSVRDVLQELSGALGSQITPDASSCMSGVINKYDYLPSGLMSCLRQLSASLGRFDLSGQVQGIGSVKKMAELEIEKLSRNKDVRLRSYQTLGLCAGAALVVLFL